jgi:hypothetical protein
MSLTLPGVEKRLQTRYARLVQEHAGHAHAVASGPRLLPEPNTPQAGAMAAWRFYLNPRTTFTRLAQPLLQAGCEAASRHCHDFALVDVDWAKLHFFHHPSKVDRTQIGKRTEIGYKLLSALLISDQDGQPLAPLCQELLTAEGVLSSRFDEPQRFGTALDDLAPLMAFVRDLPLGRRPVFIIDAEGDSIYHWRDWQARDLLFLARGDDDRKVRLGGPQGEEMLLPAVALRLGHQRKFRRARTVSYEGRPVSQYVAEAAVVIDRPAWLHREVDGQRKRLVRPGARLPLRLVVTELRGQDGEVLERWYLLTNVPAEVRAARIALWYYWRWKIETYHKLLKSAGQHVERWQQENGRALLKRLLVASMACVLAWRLASSQAPQADEARRVVMRLSGRQVAYGKDYTLEGLLAGIWVLLAMVTLQEWFPAPRLQEMADFVLNGSVAPALAKTSVRREAG